MDLTAVPSLGGARRDRGEPGMIEGMASPGRPYMPNELLSRLIGLRLLSIELILDYLQLRFDGDPDDSQPIMTCEVWPEVELVDGSVHQDGAPGYTDALRSLIGLSVISTDEGTGIGLRLTLTSGAIVLHPSRDELSGPEIAVLSGFPDRAWMCWRPGEQSFEDLA